MDNQEQEAPPEEIEGMDIRYTEPSDAPYLRDWLKEPGILHWFPMYDDVEIEDAVNRWIAFYRYKCSLTVTMHGVPCGIATLYLQPYRKLAHQCEFGIIVGTGNRNKGIGRQLIRNLIHLAKNYFKVELLHLQVYAENPAIRLYQRMGFVEFGRQTHWIKEGTGQYCARVFMEKFI